MIPVLSRPTRAHRNIAAGGGASSLLTGIRAYWMLDEASGTRNDSVGSNHLTDHNTVGQTTGILGNCATFAAASTRYLTLANNADVALGDEDFTFAGWFWLTQYDSFPEILGKTESAIGYEAFWDSLAINWRVHTPGGNVTVTKSFSTTGAWTFLEVWHDHTNDLIGVNLNNGIVATASATGGIVNTSADHFSLGARGGGALPLTGRLDGIGLWGRLLTPTERGNLYNSGAGLDYPF